MMSFDAYSDMYGKVLLSLNEQKELIIVETFCNCMYSSATGVILKYNRLALIKISLLRHFLLLYIYFSTDTLQRLQILDELLLQ